MNYIPLRINIKVDAVLDDAAKDDLDKVIQEWSLRHFSTNGVKLLHLGNFSNLQLPEDVVE